MRMGRPLTSEQHRALQEIVVDLRATEDDLVQELVEVAVARQPQLDALGVRKHVVGSVRANLAEWFDALATGADPGLTDVSAEHALHTRELVRAGLPLADVIKGYRLVNAYMVDRWTTTMAERNALDAQTRISLIGYGTHRHLVRLETMLGILEDEYRAELQRLGEERSQGRFRFVLALLNGSISDEATVYERLGYRLAGTHVALVLHDPSGSADRLGALDAELDRLVGQSRASGRLTVQAENHTMWCWLQEPRIAAGRLSQPSGMMLAAGLPERGLDGFRRSHVQAIETMRVAQLSAEPRAMSSFDEVELIGLCTTNPARASEFVHRELGVLAAAGETARRQRETLGAFLASGRSFRAAAALLGLHHNTVRYRIDAVERALERPIEQRPFELEAAVRLHALLFGSA